MTQSDSPSTTDATKSAYASTDHADVTDGDLRSEEVFFILSNDRRRKVIEVLCEVDGTISVNDLADRVFAAQRSDPEENPDDDACQNLYISLYQTHVPALEDAGVVEYDSDRGVVEPTDAIEVFERHLETSTSPDAGRSDWMDYYVLGGSLSVALWAVHALALVKGYGLVLHSTSVLSTLAVVASDLYRRAQSAIAEAETPE